MRFDVTLRASCKGIPLADAGDCGFMSASATWARVGSWWFYKGPVGSEVTDRNLLLAAIRPEGMSDAEFTRAARDAARQLARHAKGVRVRLMEDGHAQ